MGVTDIAYGHKFVSAATGAITGTGGPFTPTNAVYESHTGTLTLTIPSHGRSSGNVQIVENSLTFKLTTEFLIFDLLSKFLILTKSSFFEL